MRNLYSSCHSSGLQCHHLHYKIHWAWIAWQVESPRNLMIFPYFRLFSQYGSNYPMGSNWINDFVRFKCMLLNYCWVSFKKCVTCSVLFEKPGRTGIMSLTFGIVCTSFHFKSVFPICFLILLFFNEFSVYFLCSFSYWYLTLFILSIRMSLFVHFSSLQFVCLAG